MSATATETETKTRLLQEVSDLLESKKEEFRIHSVEEMQGSKVFGEIDLAELQDQSRAFYEAYILAIRSGNYDATRNYAKTIARNARLSSLRVDQILAYFLILRDITGR